MCWPEGLDFVCLNTHVGKGHTLGIPGWSMPSSIGRGRAMVRPAWMTHGIGVGGESNIVVNPCETTTCINSREHSVLERSQREGSILNSIFRKDDYGARKQKRKDKRETRRYHSKKEKQKKRQKEDNEYFRDHRRRF